MGLSFFFSVCLLVAYGNQNQTTHVKAPLLATLALEIHEFEYLSFCISTCYDFVMCNTTNNFVILLKVHLHVEYDMHAEIVRTVKPI